MKYVVVDKEEVEEEEEEEELQAVHDKGAEQPAAVKKQNVHEHNYEMNYV